METVYPFHEDTSEPRFFGLLAAVDNGSRKGLPFSQPVPADAYSDSENSAWGLILARVHSISNAVAQTCLRNQSQLEQASDLIAEWMRNQAVVRLLGAGRALLAGSMPANRPAHVACPIFCTSEIVSVAQRVLNLILCQTQAEHPPNSLAVRRRGDSHQTLQQKKGCVPEKNRGHIPLTTT